MENGNFTEAHDEFVKLQRYKESEDMIKENRYRNALFLYNNKQYDEALGLLLMARTYKDSANLILETRYLTSKIALENKEYNLVYLKLSDQLGYKDSGLIVQTARYEEAITFYEKYKISKNFEELKKAYDSITKVGSDVDNSEVLKEIIKAEYIKYKL